MHMINGSLISETIVQGALDFYVWTPCNFSKTKGFTLPKTNIAPENRPFQHESSLPTINFQVQTVSFREGKRANRSSSTFSTNKKIVELKHVMYSWILQAPQLNPGNYGGSKPRFWKKPSRFKTRVFQWFSSAKLLASCSSSSCKKKGVKSFSATICCNDGVILQQPNLPTNQGALGFHLPRNWDPDPYQPVRQQKYIPTRNPL